MYNNIHIFFILQVLFKMEMSGMCDCIELSEALANLGMTQTKFLEMCIVAGCDYLPNIRGIGINKARKLVVEEADLMKALLNLKNVPEGYKNRFLEAKSVFLHQTVIDTKTKETVPLSEWRDTPVATTQQNMCGKYPFNLYDSLSAVWCHLYAEKTSMFLNKVHHHHQILTCYYVGDSLIHNKLAF